jgi:hypothetical protein
MEMTVQPPEEDLSLLAAGKPQLDGPIKVRVGTVTNVLVSCLAVKTVSPNKRRGKCSTRRESRSEMGVIRERAPDYRPQEEDAKSRLGVKFPERAVTLLLGGGVAVDRERQRFRVQPYQSSMGPHCEGAM